MVHAAAALRYLTSLLASLVGGVVAAQLLHVPICLLSCTCRRFGVCRSDGCLVAAWPLRTACPTRYQPPIEARRLVETFTFKM